MPLPTCSRQLHFRIVEKKFPLAGRNRTSGGTGYGRFKNCINAQRHCMFDDIVRCRSVGVIFVEANAIVEATRCLSPPRPGPGPVRCAFCGLRWRVAAAPRPDLQVAVMARRRRRRRIGSDDAGAGRESTSGRGLDEPAERSEAGVSWSHLGELSVKVYVKLE